MNNNNNNNVPVVSQVLKFNRKNNNEAKYVLEAVVCHLNIMNINGVG